MLFLKNKIVDVIDTKWVTKVVKCTVNNIKNSEIWNKKLYQLKKQTMGIIILNKKVIEIFKYSKIS